MLILTAPQWRDYELLDTGNGMRLERFGAYTLVRPDPQILWKPHLDASAWAKADAVFGKDRNGKEKWVTKRAMPEKWLMQYNDIKFWAKMTPFKHTGVFPEQTVQWDWMKEKIVTAKRPINILNLFAYTGIASLVAASCGAKVTHVDASKPAISWAKENQTASGLSDKFIPLEASSALTQSELSLGERPLTGPIRWMVDDALKFTARELKRGVRYDGIIMDPPVYGHGPEGETWDFMKDFPKLLETCIQLLSDKPVFILVNAYAVSASALMLENVLGDIGLGGTVEAGELALQEGTSDRLLSTGIFGRWCSV